MSVTSTYKRVAPRNRTAWRAWLKKSHTRSPGVWLLFHRKSSGRKTLDYNDAVEEALCFGWIDSIVKSVDATRYAQLFTPRKAKSVWSATNKVRVERLLRSRLMTAAGRAKIDAAKKDGSWNALDAVDSLTVPPDLKRALAANPRAKKNFEGFSPTRKKQVLYDINAAKRPETRRRRIELAVASAAENRTRYG